MNHYKYKAVRFPLPSVLSCYQKHVNAAYLGLKYTQNRFLNTSLTSWLNKDEYNQ